MSTNLNDLFLCRGDPEKCDNYGNTALHLAAAKEPYSFPNLTLNLAVNH